MEMSSPFTLTFVGAKVFQA